MRKNRQKQNSVNLEQLEGGFHVKQGDSGSLFSFRLLEENGTPINLDGKDATIRLVDENFNFKFEKTTKVDKDIVSFYIDQIVEIGLYTVEIWAGGYVFPSDYQVKLKVTQTSNEYIPVELVNERELLEDIKKRLEELPNTTNQANQSSSYLHQQSIASTEWVINHNLNRYPDPVVIDSAGTMIQGAVQYNDRNTLTITFNVPVLGHAELD